MTEDTALLNGVGYDSGPGRVEEADKQAAQDRLASMLLRKAAMPHDPHCRGRCRHRNCGRDHRHLSLLLDALDLDDEPVRAEDYHAGLVWHSMSRNDAQIMAWKKAS